MADVLDEKVIDWFVESHKDYPEPNPIYELLNGDLTFRQLNDGDMDKLLQIQVPDTSPETRGLEYIVIPLNRQIKEAIAAELSKRCNQLELTANKLKEEPHWWENKTIVENLSKGASKMANENTTTQKYEMSAEEIALREELAGAMASKAAEGKAVWQVPKDERPIMHTPVNPRTGNYFQNGTALVLMQAQFEQKTADNRWISAKALNVLKEKEGKDIFVKKGAAAVTIVSGAKPVKYFNYSQLHGKDVPNGIEIVDKTKDSLGESMLNYMQYKATQAKDKAEVTKENFWELGKKAQYSATCFVQKMQTELEKSMSVFKDAMPEFENRLANIKGFDKQAEAKTDDDRFMRSMAWNLAKNPDKNDYVMKAAAAALIKQVPEKTVIKLIDKYAPEAAKDAVKQEQGKGKYSAFVMGVLKKDKMLEKKIAEGKNKSAAR